ncbi:RNA polymerase sigma factor [Ulvibacterium marinum]|uniref:RNA polymerase sigma factor n=2 Tax=Ulvibacterium marinum TaxID=2419782 RepID=A0A3B0CB48_9FLAO|nr:RNA polymerase sigma factor [Ulvibacterium marinum]
MGYLLQKAGLTLKQTTNLRIPLEIGRKPRTLSDEELVHKIVQVNDPLLFGHLYDRYAQRIYNKCYGFSKSKDEAEDLTQDVFLKLYLKLDTFKGKSKFSTWLYAFTYNFCVNYVRRKNLKKMDHPLDNIGDPDFMPLFEVSEEQLMQVKATRLKKALELITAEDKSLLLLKYQDDVSVKELGILLGVTEGAIKMRLKRARQKVIRAYHKLT